MAPVKVMETCKSEIALLTMSRHLTTCLALATGAEGSPAARTTLELGRLSGMDRAERLASTTQLVSSGITRGSDALLVFFLDFRLRI